jgi:hypothetical protein
VDECKDKDKDKDKTQGDACKDEAVVDDTEGAGAGLYWHTVGLF